MSRVVLDTNVFISAILTPGQSRRVLDTARKGDVELFISEAILGEIERVLRLKLNWDSWKVEVALQGIRDISTFVSPARRLSVVAADEADNRILECALEARAEYIVSGDERHLLSLKEFQGMKIVSPGEFCNLSQRKPDG